MYRAKPSEDCAYKVTVNCLHARESDMRQRGPLYSSPGNSLTTMGDESSQLEVSRFHCFRCTVLATFGPTGNSEVREKMEK